MASEYKILVSRSNLATKKEPIDFRFVVTFIPLTENGDLPLDENGKLECSNNIRFVSNDRYEDVENLHTLLHDEYQIIRSTLTKADSDKTARIQSRLIDELNFSISA